MQESIEKAYFFSKKEFLVLLGLAGIREIYSFELPKSEEITSEELIYSLYQLTQKKLVRMEGKPELSPDMAEIMGFVREGKRALSVIPGKDKDQLIAYFSPDGIGVMEICPDKGGLRAGKLSEEELWERISGAESLGQALLETEEEGQALERYNEPARQDRERFESQVLPGLVEDFFRAAEKEDVYAAWELFDLEERRARERILFLKGTFCSWILRQDEEGRFLVPDSLESREKLRRHIFSRREKG